MTIVRLILSNLPAPSPRPISLQFKTRSRSGYHNMAPRRAKAQPKAQLKPRSTRQAKPQPKPRAKPRPPHYDDEPIVPFEIRQKRFRLGHVQNWDKSTTPPTVFGLFSEGGRFYLRIGHEGSVSIAHDEVQYLPKYQGWSKKQVRDKVREELINKVGPVLGPGEI
ncbi:hypothetical protein EDB80DRAFT_743510 [Ilyonectria destructans]|nr:hypothetical protein EDB80DRAFT_743510 [Ilyonectria destructans]